YDLVALFSDGSQQTVDQIAFILGIKDDYSSQWRNRLEPWRKHFTTLLQVTPMPQKKGDLLLEELRRMFQSNPLPTENIGRAAADLARNYLQCHGLPVESIGFLTDSEGPVSFASPGM